MLNIQSRKVNSEILNALVARYQDKGEDNCMELIIEATVNFVRSVVNSLRFSGSLHDDLFQVGLMAIARCAETYDASRGFDFLSYAGQSVRNRMLNEVQKFYNHSHTSMETPIGDNLTLGDTMVSYDGESRLGEIESVRKAMECLTDVERDTIEKTFFEGRSLQDVAMERGCTRQAVNCVQKRAMQKIKAEVKL